MSDFTYDESILPSDINEAIDIMETIFKKLKRIANKLPEHDFISGTLFTMGLFLKDSWFLDWMEDNEFDKGYPKERPLLQRQFLKLGVYAPIDMTEILIRLLYMKFTTGEYDIDSIIEQYKW